MNDFFVSVIGLIWYIKYKHQSDYSYGYRQKMFPFDETRVCRRAFFLFFTHSKYFTAIPVMTGVEANPSLNIKHANIPLSPYPNSNGRAQIILIRLILHSFEKNTFLRLRRVWKIKWKLWAFSLFPPTKITWRRAVGRFCLGADPPSDRPHFEGVGNAMQMFPHCRS